MKEFTKNLGLYSQSLTITVYHAPTWLKVARETTVVRVGDLVQMSCAGDSANPTYRILWSRLWCDEKAVNGIDKMDCDRKQQIIKGKRFVTNFVL